MYGFKIVRNTNGWAGGEAEQSSGLLAGPEYWPKKGRRRHQLHKTDGVSWTESSEEISDEAVSSISCIYKSSDAMYPYVYCPAYSGIGE